MSAEEFKARLAASREKWVEIGDGRALLLRRPSYLQQCEMRDKSPGAESYMTALIQTSAKDWRGFTAADLLPGEPDEPIKFDAEMMQAAMDNQELRGKISGAFVEFWIEAFKQREQAEKN